MSVSDQLTPSVRLYMGKKCVKQLDESVLLKSNAFIQIILLSTTIRSGIFAEEMAQNTPFPPPFEFGYFNPDPAKPWRALSPLCRNAKSMVV